MNSDILKIFIDNLSELRKNRGCSSKLLSELIGCDPSYISKVENGRIKPSIDKIIAIADYFEIDFIELFKKQI